ncbi:predicted protein [Naegleria gruberi]|uniref:Predicted protein n=1 Tax=Naegleria gruberi TaxID=5762 RepID=D2VTM5_NAEGR|nr:uncharacterized protein NAEGRDRAFT_52151 [Naegleria gruberi]EFC39886.1 predicted protein [Naegleria gruberi]|eukprot:XP_002672630.1 predicted protein [Naegleria gruberi strain NEG-M]
MVSGIDTTAAVTTRTKSAVPTIPAKYFKKLQGPPSEFSLHAYPKPSEGAIQSDFYLYVEKFKKSESLKASTTHQYEWSARVAVDSSEQVDLSLLSQYVKSMRVQVLDQHGTDITSMASFVVDEESFGAFSDGENNLLPSKTLRFDANSIRRLKINQKSKQTSIGSNYIDEWIVNVFVDAPASAPTYYDDEALHLLVYNQSPLRAYTQLQSYDNQLVGENVIIETFMYDEDVTPVKAINDIPRPIRVFATATDETILSAQMEILSPSGQETSINMLDNGLLGDRMENDGIYSAALNAQEAGDYVITVSVKGVIKGNAVKNISRLINQDLVEFERSTHHVVSIVKKSLELTQNAVFSFNAPSVKTAQIADVTSQMVDVKLVAKPLDADALGKKFKAYAEVYSAGDAKSSVPIAFVSGMAIAEKCDGTECPEGLIYLPLQMSLAWVALARQQSNGVISAPFILKNVNIQDVATSNIITKADQTLPELTSCHIKLPEHTLYNARPVDINYFLNTHEGMEKFDGVITESMLFGPRPTEIATKSLTSSTQHKVLLIHGYCSGYAPFPSSDFTNAVYFSDHNANRNNDEFASMIFELGQTFDSFSMVGHSQGGLASLHLFAYYWTHADVAAASKKTLAGETRRIIQSVGSPYRGSGLAGVLASIGKVVGIGCGKQTDLTYDGASKWLSSIPVAARQALYYSYTQYKDWSWCSLPANAVLKLPNDGTCEKSRASVDGANHYDSKKGWCHTNKMKYKGQCEDSERNAVLNKYAQL